VEQFNLQKLTCDSTAEEIFYDFDKYMGGFNYEMKFVKCPTLCWKSMAKVTGLGIHPQKTPICAAAIVDNAMPFYGGVVAISKVAVPDGFDGTKRPIKGFTVI